MSARSCTGRWQRCAPGGENLVMNEELLNAYRKEPRPEFADRLRERINRSEPVREHRPDTAFLARWKPVLAGATAIAVAVVALTVPSVRAAAQDFLDLFRVKRFVAVSIDDDRIGQLRGGKVDLRALIGDSVEEIKVPGEPRIVATADEAEIEIGAPVLVPTLAFGLTTEPTIRVTDSADLRLTANAEKIGNILEVLGIEDAMIPPGLDGANVAVHIPKAVIMEYRRSDDAWVATLTQARSPEVVLPEGLDIAALGELGLRITGLSADEAHQFAKSIDWRSTFIVPVPTRVGSFSEVEVRGTKGVLISIDPSKSDKATKSAKDPRPRSILMWSENGMVYALASLREAFDIVETANSMR